MSDFNPQVALDRIEGKLDTVIVAHAERLTAIETSLESMKQDARDTKIKNWAISGGAYLLTILGVHLPRFGTK